MVVAVEVWDFLQLHAPRLSHAQQSFYFQLNYTSALQLSICLHFQSRSLKQPSVNPFSCWGTFLFWALNGLFTFTGSVTMLRWPDHKGSCVFYEMCCPHMKRAERAGRSVLLLRNYLRVEGEQLKDAGVRAEQEKYPHRSPRYLQLPQRSSYVITSQFYLLCTNISHNST